MTQRMRNGSVDGNRQSGRKKYIHIADLRFKAGRPESIAVRVNLRQDASRGGLRQDGAHRLEEIDAASRRLDFHSAARASHLNVSPGRLRSHGIAALTEMNLAARRFNHDRAGSGLQDDVAPAGFGANQPVDDSGHNLAASGIQQRVAVHIPYADVSACRPGLHILTDIPQIDHAPRSRDGHRPADISCMNVSARRLNRELTIEIGDIDVAPLSPEVQIEFQGDVNIEMRVEPAGGSST